MRIMSLESNNTLHQARTIYDPLLATLEFSQRLSDIMYGSMRDFYDAFSYQNNKEDPFYETKKKCLPSTIDHLPMNERSDIRMQTSYYSCAPLTIEKRDGPSFTNQTMNNLIIDDEWTLIQLLFWLSISDSVLPGQRLMQVTEYKKWSKTVARKFERYI